jgi:hypothetical protein
LRKADALAGLERWKARYPEAAARLHVDDVLVDSMRGRSTNWARIRINLCNVPEDERPPKDPPEPDYEPWLAGAHGGPYAVFSRIRVEFFRKDPPTSTARAGYCNHNMQEPNWLS